MTATLAGRKILLIAEAIPPAPIVGSFRAWKVASAFRSHGASIHVIAMRGGTGDVGHGVSPEGITWERVVPWLGPRQMYLKLRKSGSAVPETNEGTPPGRDRSTPAMQRGSARQTVAALLSLPDDKQGFIPAVRRAVKRGRQSYDLVYATAPCFSALLAGRMAGHWLRAPWIAELRDPWVGHTGKSHHSNVPIVDALDRWLEGSCLRSATAIVTVTPLAKELYQQRYSRWSVPVIAALNGIDAVEPAILARKEGPLRIVYAGSVYPPRNPAPLVRALGAACGRINVGPVELCFVGARDWAEAPDLAEAVDALPPFFSVLRSPWLPQADARSLVNSADLLLLPAQEWFLQVPNKLYDYLGSRVPVFAIAETGSDTERMLAQAGGHFVSPAGARESELARLAERALRAAAAGCRAGEADVVGAWTTDAQMCSLMKQVSEVLGQPPI